MLAIFAKKVNHSSLRASATQYRSVFPLKIDLDCIALLAKTAFFRSVLKTAKVQLFNVVLVVCLFMVTSAYANSHKPEDFLNSISGSKDEGMQIVQHFCVSCHAAKPLIPIGAPRMLEEADWLPRIKKGVDHLFRHAAEGEHAMPARGGCFECSDRQLVLALLAMLPDALKNDYKNELGDLKKYK